MSEAKELLQYFGGYTNKQFASLSGRATTLLYALFKTLSDGVRGKTVLFPAIMCPHPVYAAKIAGIESAFMDVDPSIGIVTPQTFEEAIRRNPNATIALIAHTFGSSWSIFSSAGILSHSNWANPSL